MNFVNAFASKQYSLCNGWNRTEVCVCVEASHCLAYASIWTHARTTPLLSRSPIHMHTVSHSDAFLGRLVCAYRFVLYSIELFVWARTTQTTAVILMGRQSETTAECERFSVYVCTRTTLVYKLFWRRMFEYRTQRPTRWRPTQATLHKHMRRAHFDSCDSCRDFMLYIFRFVCVVLSVLRASNAHRCMRCLLMQLFLCSSIFSAHFE